MRTFSIYKMPYIIGRQLSVSLPHQRARCLFTGQLKISMWCDGIIQYFVNKRGYRTSSNSSTIFALSSGIGKCGVAVIRVSGPQCKLAMQKLSGIITRPRVATLREVKHPVTGEALDKAIILSFPGPNSFTGEDCAEFHVHGGPAVVTSVLDALSSLPSLRYASPGEFTKQAFINNKMDLTEVEGLGDLIHAETEAQRKQALRQMNGELGQLYSSWRQKLIKCLASCEAYIDFSEEENIEDDVLDRVNDGVHEIEREVSAHLKDSRCGERLRNGVHIALLGQPNVGKSSLLNIFARRPAAIVSPIPGTTRDVVESALNFAGYPVVISDTAGLRLTTDEIEEEGVKRALDRARNSDLKILMFDSLCQEHYLRNFSTKSDLIENFMKEFDSKLCGDKSSVCESDDPSVIGRRDEINESTGRCDNDAVFSKNDTMVVVNKMDLIGDKSFLEYLKGQKSFQIISCTTGEGVDVFLEALTEKIKELCGNPLEGPPSLTHSRHRVHLSACLDFLKEFHRFVDYDFVLATERLRLASREIGQITGTISAEDVLDVLFQDFCIGK